MSPGNRTDRRRVPLVVRTVLAMLAVVLLSSSCADEQTSRAATPFGPDPCGLVDADTFAGVLGDGWEVDGPTIRRSADTCSYAHDDGSIARVAVPFTIHQSPPRWPGSVEGDVAGTPVRVDGTRRSCRILATFERDWLTVVVRLGDRSGDACRDARALMDDALAELELVKGNGYE